MKSTFNYKTIIGEVFIVEENNFITELKFNKEKIKTNAIEKETPLIKETYEQLLKYFNGEIKEFSIPVKLEGTDFQKKVWAALQEIPYGKTCTYKQIAQNISRPKACRAVGLANNKNPVSIIVPCHRVIGSNGKLVGYGGGLDVKKTLLQLEGVAINNE